LRTQVIPLIVFAIAEAGLLALIPVVLIAGGTRLINGLQDARLPWTPNVELAAFATGAAGGVIVFAHTIDLALLGPSAVFEVGGPWDMSPRAFVAEMANPLRYDLSALLSPYGTVLLILAGLLTVAPIVLFRGPAAIANGIRNAFLCLGGAYAMVYGLGYCLWLLNRLNFWIFLLLMIIIHMRSRSKHVVFKLH
jgi:hypothetical protein